MNHVMWIFRYFVASLLYVYDVVVQVEVGPTMFVFCWNVAVVGEREALGELYRRNVGIVGLQ